MPSLAEEAAKHLNRPPAPVPQRPSLKSLREAVHDCRACDLWEGATQAVMGEGARQASLMLVGEQPGDREDIEGHPFVGPAGRVLDHGLEQAGIARDEVYITNAVKHFRYKLRGKRRMHQKPDRWQLAACFPWLAAARRWAARGGTPCANQTDVAEFDQVNAAASAIEARLGPIDVWVNDAMTTVFAFLDDIEPDEFERATRVTYLGAVWGTKAALA